MTVREGLIYLWVQRLVSRNWKQNDAAFGRTQMPPTFFLSEVYYVLKWHQGGATLMQEISKRKLTYV